MDPKQPSHHHSGSGLDPAMPKTENSFGGHGTDPQIDDGKATEGKTSGQPDTWPQRPDVPVERSKTLGGEHLLGKGIVD